ncbi:type III pantothenate kinase [Cyanobium sp. FACHB-13342]|uniref:type III pantothenate kinase n=1 Tax=Cyanobium sp. FACHB-13342 TaxID=2692793 RepID=UPI00167FFEB5|nr:type III pantothenate kinase [Cyanobium sp. FACHB-13342]
MRHPSARLDGRGHLSPGLWLLIGNSRWHWAKGHPGALHTWSDAPGRGVRGALTGWAAVGPVPADGSWPSGSRLETAEVPLARMPSWLGVDRALVGWRAWQRSQTAVLVADGGTALSLTRVDADGGFAGGRLLAGARLQLQALRAGTAGLPALDGPPVLTAQPWPQATAEAMACGVLRGLAAAVAQAGREALAEAPRCTLWLTGGDGPMLAPLVRELLADSSLVVECDPALALEALAALRPVPDR